MPAPASSLSPLTIAALLASVAAHGSVAMYMVNHEAGAPAVVAADENVTAIDVETVAIAEPAQPEVPAPVEPLPGTTPTPNHVQSASDRPAAAAPLAPPVSAPVPVPVRAAAPVPAVAAAAAAALTAPGDDSPHFAMVLGAGSVAAGGVTRAVGGAAPGSAPAASDAPLSADGVDKLARLESGPAPAYPSDARDNGVEADVPLDIVVDENGRVTDVRPTRHLGYGLDESAAQAIRGYRFSPAMRGGRPVKVRMRWTVVFRLG